MWAKEVGYGVLSTGEEAEASGELRVIGVGGDGGGMALDGVRGGSRFEICSVLFAFTDAGVMGASWASTSASPRAEMYCLNCSNGIGISVFLNMEFSKKKESTQRSLR